MAEELDDAMMAVLVTALMIREGGHAVFSAAEWQKAIDHEGSLYIKRKDEDQPVDVALLGKVVQA